MIALAALLAAAQADPAALVKPAPVAPPTPVVTIPPADWSELPPLRFIRPWPARDALSQYVRQEVRAGRCTAAQDVIRVDLAVLVAGGGQLRRIVPRAIQCPTVEQYASGLVLRMARGNIPAPAADRWYQTTMIFTLR